MFFSFPSLTIIINMPCQLPGKKISLSVQHPFVKTVENYMKILIKYAYPSGGGSLQQACGSRRQGHPTVPE